MMDMHDRANALDPGPRRGRNMEWVAQFEGQMLACAMLAKALYGPPDRAWIDTLIEERIFETAPCGERVPEVARGLDLLKGWAARHPHGLDDVALWQLRDDYTQLFVGPGQLGAAPWESVYLNKDRAVFQLETVSVKNWYLRFNLVLASSYNEPADHIGLEFSFLAHLAELTIEASEIRDGAQVKRLIDAQRAFLANHVLRWAPLWADAVTANARTEFYKGLALLSSGIAQEAGSFFSATAPSRQTGGAFQKL